MNNVISKKKYPYAHYILEELPSNPFHGYLLLIYELLNSFYKQADSGSADMGDNKVFQYRIMI
jgi:hypothetical protein